MQKNMKSSTSAGFQVEPGFFGTKPREEPAHREGDEVHDSVPVDFERTEAAERSNLERDLVEAGVLDHVSRSLVIRA
jgi:hypothetical protein